MTNEPVTDAAARRWRRSMRRGVSQPGATIPLCPPDVEMVAEDAAMAEWERCREIPYGAPPGSLRWPWRAAIAVAWKRGYERGYADANR